MRRYKIHGEKDNSKHYCKTCRGGKLFFEEQLYNTNVLGNNHKEGICGVCNTKYKQAYIPLPILVDSFDGHNVTKKDMKVFRQTNDGSLNIGNVAQHLIMFGEKLKQVTKMNEIEKRKEIYEKTGKCECIPVLSHPFTTSEGRFQVSCCPICMTATMDYKGVIYTDKVMNLVRYVAHQGIVAEETQKAVETKLDGLFDVEVIKDAELTTTEMPSFEVADEPSFELEKPVF